jgi:TRAP-type C4-dicarboxylate transport system permease small subunit
MHFEWTTLIIQLIVIMFWIFIIYAAVTLVKNSKSNTKILQNIERDLAKLNERLDQK